MIWRMNQEERMFMAEDKTIDDTPPEAKVKITTVHLEGKALQWHQIFMKNRLTREVPQWGEYVKALNDRFGALLYEDPMLELVNLKQTGSIQDYLDRFDELMNCVDLFEPYAISCFLGGLKSEVSIHVRMFRPRSLQDAMAILSPQELDDKRARGLCFWCNEKLTTGYQCSRRKQLYIMEVTKEEVEEDEMEQSEELTGGNKEENNEQEENHISSYHVSMNAMTGIHDFRTMRVTEGGCEVVLGIQCLVTLGDINWNLKELKMVFYIEGQKVSLRGKQPPTMETVSNKQMKKCLHNPAQVAMMHVGVFASAPEEGSSIFQIEQQLHTTGSCHYIERGD
ncbi:hypothetical protein BUALT_Bualt03G0171300 [Buddleja alternifolia]|uniref:Retrotransposon gag domain-containing protein n=1 Tax=Buddleja alternifolia TaxID=168488 RepID=A0AAV6Y1C5_9LAMI|nr:hypothetical protein BUALT_Bualt03G0171300 [Buddleja alternifolia]